MRRTLLVFVLLVLSLCMTETAAARPRGGRVYYDRYRPALYYPYRGVLYSSPYMVRYPVYGYPRTAYYPSYSYYPNYYWGRGAYYGGGGFYFSGPRISFGIGW